MSLSSLVTITSRDLSSSKPSQEPPRFCDWFDGADQRRDAHSSIGNQGDMDISTLPSGQRVGLKEVDDAIWLVSFMQ
jgi:hypothetical protein